MIVYLSLFFVGIIGGFLVFFQKSLNRHLNTLLSFSGAFLLGVSFLHLLPEVFHEKTNNVGLFLLIGFFLQLVLDYFSGGIEHGHAHVNKKAIGQFPYLVFLSLCLHALLEAFPLNQLNEGYSIGAYLSGLLLHKAPIAFVLASLLLGYQLKKRVVLFAIVVFSLMGPLGAWMGSHLNPDTDIFKQLLAVSVGIILHLSTTILFEDSESHQISWKKLAPMIVGALLALLTLQLH